MAAVINIDYVEKARMLPSVAHFVHVARCRSLREFALFKPGSLSANSIRAERSEARLGLRAAVPMWLFRASGTLA